MYFLLKMVIFQLAMLVYQRVIRADHHPTIYVSRVLSGCPDAPGRYQRWLASGTGFPDGRNPVNSPVEVKVVEIPLIYQVFHILSVVVWKQYHHLFWKLFFSGHFWSQQTSDCLHPTHRHQRSLQLWEPRKENGTRISLATTVDGQKFQTTTWDV